MDPSEEIDNTVPHKLMITDERNAEPEANPVKAESGNYRYLYKSILPCKVKFSNCLLLKYIAISYTALCHCTTDNMLLLIYCLDHFL